MQKRKSREREDKRDDKSSTYGAQYQKIKNFKNVSTKKLVLAFLAKKKNTHCFVWCENVISIRCKCAKNNTGRKRKKLDCKNLLNST